MCGGAPCRYTASSLRAVDERPPYGSLPRLHGGAARLDSLSRHGSAQRLESQSRHGSVRDLAGAAPGVLGIQRVLEEDGATA